MLIGKQLLTNIFSSWSANLIRIGIAFFFVPFVTALFGDARYGVWVIIFQTINYFLLLDLGMTSALNRFVSKHLAKKENNQISRIISSAGFIYLILGTLVIGAVYLFVIYFFDLFLIHDPAMVAEGRTALMILGIYFGISFYLLPYGNSLGAFHRYDLVNLLNVIEEIIRVCLWVILLSMGYGMIQMAMVILGTALLKHLVGIIILKRLNPELSLAPGNQDSQWCRRLLGYSRVTFGISICWILIHHSDSLLLGLISSSAAAGIYHPGAQFISHLRNLINAIAGPLLPVISHLDSGENIAEIRDLYLKILGYTSYVTFTLAAGVVTFAPSFIKLWLPPEFMQAASIMTILSMSAAFYFPQIIGNSVLYGIEKHKYIFYVLAVEICFKVVLAIILIPQLGLIGMALAGAIPQVLLYTTLYPILVSRAIDIPVSRIIYRSLRYGLIGVLIFYPLSLLLENLFAPTSWTFLFIDVAVVVALAVLIGYFLILNKVDQARVKSWLRLG